jgi:hypothetical protein
MMAHIEASTKPSSIEQKGQKVVDDAVDHFVSWTMEEELVTEHLFTPTPVGRTSLSAIRAFALVAAVGATVVSLGKSIANAREFGSIGGEKKDCFV